MAKRATKATTDQEILGLISLVKQKKALIKEAERSNYGTNMTFSFDEGNISRSVNLNVENSVGSLLKILGFLLNIRSGYEAAAAVTGTTPPPSFTWQGFPLETWQKDIKTRICKIEISTERQKLEVLESRLEKIVTPEMRARLELEEIKAALKN